MRRIALALLGVIPLALATPGCESPERLAAERQLAAVGDAAQASEEAGEADWAAQFRALEIRYEALLASAAAEEGVSTIETAKDALGSGDVLAALTALGLGSLAFRRRLTQLTTQMQCDLAALERRRDESRSMQGLAGASERSAVQMASAVARVAAQPQPTPILNPNPLENA